MIPVVGDFAYGQPIRDPMKFAGAAARITILAAHRNILALARESWPGGLVRRPHWHRWARTVRRSEGAAVFHRCS